jgi:glycine/D-amino acid oxidase-like deaminating enzyme
MRPSVTTPTILGVWEFFHRHTKGGTTPVFPPKFDSTYAEVTLRGMAEMLPALRPYVERGHKVAIDGSWYCKAADNRPLIGPHGPLGAYVCSAFSGYGVMSSMAGGELAAAHVASRPLPDYYTEFLPSRPSANAWNTVDKKQTNLQL